MSYSPSDAQWNFIQRLLNERHDTPVGAMAVLRGRRLTKDGADAVIKKLLTLPVINTATPAPQAGDARGSLPYNRFSGTCVLCHAEVPAQAGTYRKGTTTRWETLHLPGECPTAATPEASQVGRKGTFSDQVQEIVANIPDGRFAVPSVTGSNDLTFFLVGTGRTSGRRYVRHIVGGHEDSGRLTLDWIEQAAKAVEALGAKDCMALFGRELGSCGHCGKELTDAESRARGIGPTCALK